MNPILTVEATDKKTGTHNYLVNLLHEFGVFEAPVDNIGAIKRKIAELWIESSDFEVLFSDYTNSDPGSFAVMFMDPRGVWMEIVRETDQKIIGAGYLTDVIVNHDAYGHFTMWDSIGAGREPVLTEIMKWTFDRYNLHRMSAEIPVFMHGLARMTRRLGFTQEGVRAETRKHKGEWINTAVYGILREELYDESRT